MDLMTKQNSIKRMSDLVIECELRAAWGTVECDIRHGLQPSKRDADYIVALMAEQKRRAS
jgi:hypothetical protein